MEFITKIIGIEFSPEEKKVIEDLANKCDDLCTAYKDCSACPFKNFCNTSQTPYEALTFILSDLSEE